MSTVFMMRFNNEQGALISDESTWHLGFKYGYRRSNYGDHILPLLTPEAVERLGVAAVYAGVGFPSFHFEVAEKSREILDGSTPESAPSTIREMSDLLFNEYQRTQGRMIDDRIRFLYGFGRDGLNSLTLKRPEGNHAIKQQSVIDDARKIQSFSDHSDHLQRIFDNRGAVMGFSRREGIQAYHISGGYKGIDFAYALSVLGEGNQVASHIFGLLAATMDLEERRHGFGFLTGLLILLQVATETGQFQSKMGGYFQLVTIDGRASNSKDIIRRFAGHELKLATEVAKAYSWELIERETALRLVEGLLFGGMNFHQAEKELFTKAGDPGRLQRYLFGYKPRISQTRGSGTPLNS